ncbi:hemolysin family protein [Rhodoluna limnophila]|uniref:hemolysin family protein n=1 Tax=Rhodoluna limnophila TaxID=232537 RepID=UPI0011065171|nr:CBS domain-containing protein [Rhodoluna limnophila]
MIILAIWIAVILAVLTTVTAVLKAALEANEDPQAESLGFVRLSLTGIFGVVVGQSVSPLGWSWWQGALIASFWMFALLIGSQFAAKRLGQADVIKSLAQSAAPLILSIHLVFTPISLPKSEEPEEFEQELLDSVEEFSETIVREIMVPRVDMATVAADVELRDAMGVFLKRGYSRLPVVGKNIDDISGILYMKDVARLLHESPSVMAKRKASAVARPVIFVPESKQVDDLLREMQLSSTHIAVVIDEYGGVAGLATMEDVIEEIVGEISDEYDRDDLDFVDLGDGRYRVNARFPLSDLGENLELELEDEDVDSIGGLLAKALGRLPKFKDEVTVSGLNITAERIEGKRKRLTSVIVQKAQSLADAQSAFEQLDQEN